MGKIRRGGYVFVTWVGDHRPAHVHIYRDCEFVAKFDLENNQVIDGYVSSRLLKLIEELRLEGKL